MKKQIFPAAAIAALTLSSCSQELFNAPGQEETDNSGRIQLAGEINQVATTRVNDEGFADGDVMGVYIVDYEGTQPGTLLSKGNRGDNVRHTFNEAAYRWDSAYDLFWKDKHTRIDVYGYYPFGAPDNVNSYEFTVRTDQYGESTDGSMGGYEASDFLWGKVEGIEPTTNVIRLPMTHRMANARVTLTEG
ncbi:MAG: fimbrillin family protein, partial [Muribaculaceae bacterium]|nr:fimbrillin family protein [Muribaculaceae bacterium]